MKTKFLTLAFSLMTLVSGNVFAGGASGVIANPLVNEQGYFMFGAGNHDKKPSCATVGDAQSWAFDSKTPAGKSMQASIMLAFALGKKVFVAGAGDCSAWGDREKPSYIQILN